MALGWTILTFGLLGFGAYFLSGHAFQQPHRLVRGLAAVVIGWTWLTLGMETLGDLGWLTREGLLGWSMAGFVVGLGSRAFGRQLPGPSQETQASEPWAWTEIIAVALVLWASLLLGTVSLFGPVKVVSDGPIYHLYFAARWWKSHRLDLIPIPFGESAAPYFPAVGDLWYAFLMIVWGGERLAKIGQVPFLVVAGFTTFALSRRLGASRPSAVIATCWFLSATPFLLFSFEPNVDTILVAGYLLSVYFFTRHARGDGGYAPLVLGTLAASAALGTKATGIVFVPPLLLLGMISAVARGRGLKEKLTGIMLVAVLPLAVDGFWYARNFRLTGNPLYPLHMTMFGRVWLSGWYGPAAMRQSQYYIAMGDWRALIDQFVAVVDPRFAPFWVASLAGVWWWKGRRSGENTLVWLISALAMLNIALFWIAIPYRTQQRFMFHAIGLAVVPLARLIDWGRWLRVFAVALLAIHFTTPPGWLFPGDEPPWDLSRLIPNGNADSLISLPVSARNIAAMSRVPGSMLRLAINLGIGAGALGVVLVWVRAPKKAWGRRVFAAIAVLAGVSAATYPWGVHERLLFYPNFREYIRGWIETDLRCGPNSVRIAYAGTDLPFYLMGVGLRNEVRYVNIDAHPGWLMHDYHRDASRSSPATWPLPRPGWDRIHPDYNAWLANLRAEGIQLLVVTRANHLEGPHNIADPSGFPIEYVWANGHPALFEELYGDKDYRLYKLHFEGVGRR